MKNRPVLSIAPYYGGKGRMAHFIADRLDYNDSDIFVSPFGGMCRVLLNKARHESEIYNDFSSGLNALMTVLSDSNTADKFIHRLYEETEFSEEEFNKQKKIYYMAEKDIEEQEKESLREFLIDNGIVDTHNARYLLDELIQKKTDNHSELMETLLERMKTSKKSNDTFNTDLDVLLGNWIKLYSLKQEQGYLPRSRDMCEYVSDMDLAIATYVVFKMSRDGMGIAFSKEKFKSTDQYRAQVLKLYDCAERLNGVKIQQIDAVEFFRTYKFIDIDTPIETIPEGYINLNEWITNPKVMMMCDPSYISPVDEAKLLKGIDIYSVDNVSDVIKEKYKGKMPKDLGKIYARSFDYEDHEKFLRCIQNARCKILVCNYDIALYNKYLNESTGWRREEFITSTGVGSKANNERIEVIWYNY